MCKVCILTNKEEVYLQARRVLPKTMLFTSIFTTTHCKKKTHSYVVKLQLKKVFVEYMLGWNFHGPKYCNFAGEGLYFTLTFVVVYFYKLSLVSHFTIGQCKHIYNQIDCNFTVFFYSVLTRI